MNVRRDLLLGGVLGLALMSALAQSGVRVRELPRTTNIAQTYLLIVDEGTGQTGATKSAEFGVIERGITNTALPVAWTYATNAALRASNALAASKQPSNSVLTGLTLIPYQDYTNRVIAGSNVTLSTNGHLVTISAIGEVTTEQLIGVSNLVQQRQWGTLNLTNWSSIATSWVSSVVEQATNNAPVTNWTVTRQPASAVLTNLVAVPYQDYTNRLIPGSNITFATNNNVVTVSASITGGGASMQDVTNAVTSWGLTNDGALFVITNYADTKQHGSAVLTNLVAIPYHDYTNRLVPGDNITFTTNGHVVSVSSSGGGLSTLYPSNMWTVGLRPKLLVYETFDVPDQRCEVIGPELARVPTASGIYMTVNGNGATNAWIRNGMLYVDESDPETGADFKPNIRLGFYITNEGCLFTLNAVLRPYPHPLHASAGTPNLSIGLHGVESGDYNKGTHNTHWQSYPDYGGWRISTIIFGWQTDQLLASGTDKISPWLRPVDGGTVCPTNMEPHLFQLSYPSPGEIVIAVDGYSRRAYDTRWPLTWNSNTWCIVQINGSQKALPVQWRIDTVWVEAVESSQLTTFSPLEFERDTNGTVMSSRSVAFASSWDYSEFTEDTVIDLTPQKILVLPEMPFSGPAVVRVYFHDATLGRISEVTFLGDDNYPAAIQYTAEEGWQVRLNSSVPTNLPPNSTVVLRAMVLQDGVIDVVGFGGGVLGGGDVTGDFVETLNGVATNLNLWPATDNSVPLRVWIPAAHDSAAMRVVDWNSTPLFTVEADGSVSGYEFLATGKILAKTNLFVEGTIYGDGSGLSNVVASGTYGAGGALIDLAMAATYWCMWDEFLAVSTGTAPRFVPSGLLGAVSGSGATFTQIGSATNAPGVIRMETGSTATGRLGISAGTGSTYGLATLAYKALTNLWRVQVLTTNDPDPAVSAAHFEVGVGNYGSTTEATRGLVFSYLTNATTWYFRALSASGTMSTNTGVTVGTDWETFVIESVNTESVTNVRAIIVGKWTNTFGPAELGNAFFNGSPSSVGPGALVRSYAGTSSKQMHVDAMYMNVELLTPKRW